MWWPSASGSLSAIQKISASELASSSAVACGRLPLLPHGDHHEPEKHGVDHPEHRVDKAGDVVVLPAQGDRHEPLHEDQTTDRKRHGHAHE